MGSDSTETGAGSPRVLQLLMCLDLMVGDGRHWTG